MRASRRAPMLGLLLALAAAAPAVAQSAAALAVGGLVNSPRSFTLAELQALPWTTRDETLATARGPARATWLGVALWTLLDQSGGVAVPPAEYTRHKVTVTARDGHSVTLSLAAVAPGGGADALVAWSRDGRAFDPKRGLRLVVPGDPRNRDLRDVVEIEVN